MAPPGHDACCTPRSGQSTERLANASEDEEEATDKAHLTGSAVKVRDLGRAPRQPHRLPSSDTDDGPRQSGRRRPQLRLRLSGQNISTIRRRYGEISCPPPRPLSGACPTHRCALLRHRYPTGGGNPASVCMTTFALSCWSVCQRQCLCHHSAIAFMRSLIMIVAKFEYVSAMA